MEIGFHIPDFTMHLRLNHILVEMVLRHPNYFHDGLKISSLFGTFPGSVWNGGRYLGGTAEMRNIHDILKLFNDRGIPLRFTFTNPLITKEHLGDSYCNQIMRAANNGLNEVIVVSPILEEYIRKNYPDFPVTSSTCKQIEDIDGVKAELAKDYKYVVLDYNWNNKFDELEKIGSADRERCEILVNACCEPHCPRRGEHYRQIGEEQIKNWEHSKNLLNKQMYQYDNFVCPFMNRRIYDITELETHISPQAILEKYIPMGFKHFKIEGRTSNDINLLETYIYYMVKPEHQAVVRLEMLEYLTEAVRLPNKS